MTCVLRSQGWPKIVWKLQHNGRRCSCQKVSVTCVLRSRRWCKDIWRLRYNGTNRSRQKMWLTCNSLSSHSLHKTFLRSWYRGANHSGQKVRTTPMHARRRLFRVFQIIVGIVQMLHEKFSIRGFRCVCCAAGTDNCLEVNPFHLPIILVLPVHRLYHSILQVFYVVMM